MNFDLLITTRNRPHVLEVSLPLMLSQNRLPKHVIIVDSRDVPDQVADIVEKITSEAALTLRIIHSEPGIAYQRNLGLKHVQAPVVFMPDDDSLWFPGYTEAVIGMQRCITTDHQRCAWIGLSGE